MPPPELPADATSFVGRDDFLDVLRRALPEHRLLTLTGPGGVGKTRLALRLIRGEAGAYPDGVWVALLEGLTDPELVAHAVFAAAGLRDEQSGPVAPALGERLARRRGLLLIDNCEHLVDAVAGLVGALQRAGGGLTVLATSREPLRVPGERVLPVRPLPVPDPEGGAEALLASDAGRLLVERARAAGREPDLGAAADLARICRRLDGLPLALELAAARLGALTPGQLLARLDERFSLLGPGPRGLPDRQRTLSASIAWSVDLLDEPERRLLDQLPVFAGGFTLEAVEAVCFADGAGAAAAERLVALVDRSLVEAEPDGRHRLLESIRRWVASRLDPSPGELEERHARYFRCVAEELGADLLGPGRPAALARFDAERDNLRQALVWAVAVPERRDTARGLAGALLWAWLHRGALAEGRRWLDRAVGDATPGPGLSKAALGRGLLAWFQGDLEVVLADLERAVAAARDEADDAARGRALAFLAEVLANAGRVPEAEAVAADAEALLAGAGSSWDRGAAHNGRGNVARQAGRPEVAGECYAAAADCFARAGDAWAMAMVDRNRGILAARQGHGDAALRWLGRSLERLGRETPPERFFVSRGLDALGHALVGLGRGRDAALVLGAAEGLRDEVGAAVLPYYAADLASARAALRASLEPHELEAVRSEGRSLGVDAALEAALRLAGSESWESVPRPELALHAFGPTAVLVDGESLPAARFGYARPRELLFLLADRGRATREEIGAALWPEATPSRLRSSLGVAIHRLRRALGRPEWVRFDGEAYSLEAGSALRSDRADFEAALREAERAEGAEAAIGALGRAVALYRGDYLADLSRDEWCLARREQLRRAVLDALVELARLERGRGAHAPAVEAAARAVELDPYHESAHRELMRAEAARGDRARALRHCARLAERLERDLGVSPSPETRDLERRLRAGESV